MKIKDFGVEIWMNLYENNCEFNLAETCVESFTVRELLEIAHKEEYFNEIMDMQLNYGAIEGSNELRDNITSLYENVERDMITVTHGAIGANSLVIETIVETGDHVISVLPTYQQHYSIPESIGADVDILNLRYENNFLPDLDELRGMIKDNTKLICINNPNNPTGALMEEDILQKICDVAEKNGIYVLCDEVYRGLNHEGEYFTKSVVDLYDKGISTGSMSKTFSLAGLRIGWIAAEKNLIERVNRRRDYNTISCGKIDDALAAIALKNKDKILKRSRNIISRNSKILHEWVESQPGIEYIKPRGGTTAFLKYDLNISSEEFCVKLLQEKGVLLVPGSALHVEGFLRVGFAYSPTIFKEGLRRISEFMKEQKTHEI